MEELLAKTTQLHVSDEEEWEIDQSLSSTIARYNLRGRLVSNVDHSRGFLKKILGRIWRLKEADWNVKIQDKHDTGMFLSFSFVSEQTQSRILAKMLWYLSNGLLILGKMVNTNESWKNDLTIFPIWGRVLGVPTDFLTEKNTMRLASMAGAVISIPNSDVWMSINKLVWPGYLLPCGGSKIWVACKYEELPFMCFRCGKIRHNQKDCSLEYAEIVGADGVRAKAYGVWLKVDNELRDGFHEGLKEPRKEVQRITKEQPHISLPNQGLQVSNSFTPLVDEMEIGKSALYGKLLLNNTVKDSGDNSKINGTNGAPKPTEGTGQIGDQESDEAQHKGKRRMVETQAVMGYGKLQKIDTPANDSLGQPQLFDVPITFPKEGDAFNGGSSFTFGSGKHNLSKEHRRKVAMKKDGKNRKSKSALFPGTEGVGLGFIWTDWTGKIMAAGMHFLPHLCSVFIAEAEAVLAALKNCPIDTSSSFEVRTNCKKLVDEFNGDCNSLTMARPVINKIKRHQRFPFCTKLNFLDKTESLCRILSNTEKKVNEICENTELSKRCLEDSTNWQACTLNGRNYVVQRQKCNNISGNNLIGDGVQEDHRHSRDCVGWQSLGTSYGSNNVKFSYRLGHSIYEYGTSSIGH
ncbi:hypothetical protein G4B88_023184 [Cannabis sativa]|uniref:CCHC-type domain-containing protein n=1 Tax=Cannabis sativa TaxID=3483 RepID=A0A7J6EHC4_CANSA|nr:hypothetical protein G4B88_023184 [Cannabis sativa]